jgi:hypothetical protein
MHSRRLGGGDSASMSFEAVPIELGIFLPRILGKNE